MRIADLDRDHSQIFLDDVAPDSAFLCERMERELFGALRAPHAGRILDVAAGLGQDTRNLAEQGFHAVGVEPSKSLTDLERMLDAQQQRTPLGARLTRVRAWGEALPFASGSFDAAYCKGSLDHFDDPLACIAELARVTRPAGRVALAVANMEASALRWMRWRDQRSYLGTDARRRAVAARRHWDAPADHITRYDPVLLREHVEAYLDIEVWRGVSMLWGATAWRRLLGTVSKSAGHHLLEAADRAARAFPRLADVLIVAGTPRLSSAA